MTVPAAAREMVPLMRPGAPDKGRAAIADEVEERKRQGKGRTGVDNVLNAEVQLWWLDEWTRPDGLYGVRELTEHRSPCFGWQGQEDQPPYEPGRSRSTNVTCSGVPIPSCNTAST